MLFALKIFSLFPRRRYLQGQIRCVMTDTESSRDGSRDNADMSPMKGPDEHIREDLKVVLLKFEKVVYALSTTRINGCRSRTVAPRMTSTCTSYFVYIRILRPMIADINPYAWQPQALYYKPGCTYNPLYNTCRNYSCKPSFVCQIIAIMSGQKAPYGMKV